MSYTYDLRPEASFEDRYSQFIGFGIPKADVDTMRTTIKDMGQMRQEGGLTNGPGSRENILKQETRFSRLSPTALPYFRASPTMRGARRSKISLNATSRQRPASPSSSSAEYSRSPIKVERWTHRCICFQ
jgi:hypothetical protein